MKGKLLLIILFTVLVPAGLRAQGNKLSIQATPPKNMSVCGFDDTSLVQVYNISSSVINSISVTLILPQGVTYVAGSLTGSSVSESNITNLNKPVFSGPNLLIGQNFRFRIKVIADCDIMPLLSSSKTPQIDIRADYSGNYDLGSSIPFVPIVPSPGFASISNISYVGNVGDKFVRKVTITNYGKGPLSSLQLMRINGKDISGTTQTGFNSKTSGDTLFTWFGKSDFTKVGDKDTLLEQNESIVITDTFLIKACNKITTYYELGWGCGGKICQITKNNAAVTISSQNPNLKAWSASDDKLCYDGTTPNKQYLTLTNIGKREAKDVRITILVGTNSANTFFDTSSVYARIGYNSKPFRLHLDSASKYYTPANCVNSNIINYMRLAPGNLNPGDTLYVTWDMTRCASANCSYAFYDLNWLFSFNYKNQCNNITQTGNYWGKVYRYAQGSATAWVPTDLAAGETKDFKFLFNSFYDLPMSNTGQIRIDMVLPATLEHSLSKSDFFITNGNLTSTWYPDSVVQRGDTVRAFMGKAFKFNLTSGELTVRLTGICSKYSGNALLPVSMSLYYNPQPSCNPWIWIRPICVSFKTKVHCSSNCSQGMWFKNFEANRTSYGLPDNNNDGLPDASGSLDFSKIRREKVMFGDTITTVFTGRPKTNSTYKNWRYGYAESFITYGYYLDVVDAHLIVYKGLTLQTGTCNQVRVKKIVSGSNATFKFDFTVDSIYPKGCLSSSYRYTSNDSIMLVVRYKVTKNIGGTSVLLNFANRYYFGSVANPGNGQYFQCDTFGANLLLYGYYYANCCSDNVVYSDCAERGLSQSWYLGIGPCCQNYAGNNLFQYEYRNFVKIKSVRVHLPSGFRLGGTYFGQYRTSGVGSYVLERKDTIPPEKGTSNPYVFDFSSCYKDSGGNVNPGDDGVQGYFSYYVTPKCNLAANTALVIDYDYVFEKQGVMGTGYDTIFASSSDYFTFNPPVLNFQPAIPTVYATSDTVEWVLNYTNPSSGFNAYNVWLSPKKSSNIKVVEVRDMDADTLIKPSVDIYRAGVLAAGKLRRFKVRAVFNSCNPDSLTMYASYNCSEYPKDFASYPCTPSQTQLYIEPQNTLLQVTLTDSASVTDLCASNKMDLLLENIRSVTAYNTKVRLSLPIGMNVDASSVLLYYPLNSTPVKIGKPTLVSGTIYEWDLPKLSSAVASGFKGTSDTSRNKLRIVFRVTTNCDYASGSFVSARAVANIKCGDAIPVIPAYSDPLDIKGVTRPYYTLVKSWSDTLLPCQKPMIVKTRVIYLGPGKSGSNDRIELFLPYGTYRDTGYFNAVRNAPAKDSFTESDINGASLISWKMPSGIVPGDSMEFDIKVSGESDKISCGVLDLISRSVVVQGVVCVSTGIPCDIKVITGSELTHPLVDKGKVNLKYPRIDSRILGSDTEEINLSFTVINNGKSMALPSPIIVRYHFDQNNTGKWENTDPLLGSDTFYRSLKADSQFVVSKTLKVKAGYSCNILAVIDSAACSCTFGQLIFGAPQLKNAGNDTAICSGQPLRIGTVSVNGFSYTWNDPVVLDNIDTARPAYIGTNQNAKRDTSVLILITNRIYCSSKDTVIVYTDPVPQVQVLNKDTSICEKNPVLLVASVNGGTSPYSYVWSPTTSVQNPSQKKTIVIPDSGATYLFQSTDSRGCKNSDSVKINVYPYPKSWFNWPVTCQGTDVILSDSSKIKSGKIVLRVWKTPSYDTFGVTSFRLKTGVLSSVPVTLITTSDIGCSDTVTRAVNVVNNPAADFNLKNVCFNDSNHFTQKATIDSGSVVAFKWNFGDGYAGNGKSIAHRYASFGKYSVQFIAVSNMGCEDTSVKEVNIWAVPEVDFTSIPNCERDTVRFNNLSNLLGDTLYSWDWTFSSGGQSSVKNPNIYINKFGSYNAKLIVSSIHNCRDSFSDSYNVYAVPKAAFNAQDVCLNLKAVFQDTSFIAQGNIVKYAWDFNDGTYSSAKNPQKYYLKSGVYNPELKVTSDKGCTDSVSKTLQIWPLANPGFSAADHCFKQSLTATSSIRGGGVVKQYMWYSGDGDSFSGQNYNHIYATPGIYTVKLRTTTDHNCVSDTQGNIEVFPLPVVNAANSVPCNDDSVILDGNAVISKGLVANYFWHLSDGSTQSGKNIRKIFADSGDQWGTLIAVSDRNCMDSTTVYFRTNPKVVVDFVVSDVCLDELSNFTNKSTSTEPITKYSWDFGDGKSSNLKDPVHLYRKDGTYVVELDLETKAGCNYKTIQSTVVHPVPSPGFSIDPPSSNILSPNIVITDLSSGADSVWYHISDGFNTGLRNFGYTFSDSGTFGIWQFTSTQFNCYDSVYHEVFIDYVYTLFVPNTFTPNFDTKNELYGPRGLGISIYEMKIFNRWGEMVYETNNSVPWDGTINGEPAPQGVYAVLINLRDYENRRHVWKGTLTLLR